MRTEEAKALSAELRAIESRSKGPLLKRAADMIESMPAWISVEERLPGASENVWCYSNKNGGYMFIGYIGYLTGDWMENGILHIGDVTHWMPLPEPPKMDLKGE